MLKEKLPMDFAEPLKISKLQERRSICQNYEISRDNKGIEISCDRLVDIFENLVSLGAENINLVNPTHFASMLAEVLEEWKSPVPIVYNSSGYESVETLMAQYIPCTNLENYQEINRNITKREYNKVVDYALSKGLEKLFVQELSSADDKYIPLFDFSGVI